MSRNSIVHTALSNRWLEDQGVPDLNAPVAAAAQRMAEPDCMDAAKRSQSRLDQTSLRDEGPSLIGTALDSRAKKFYRLQLPFFEKLFAWFEWGWLGQAGLIWSTQEPWESWFFKCSSVL